MDFVSWKDRKPLVTALKAIYRAVDAKAAEAALSAFEASEWASHRPELAAGLGRGDPVLRLPRGGAQNPLHDG